MNEAIHLPHDWFDRPLPPGVEIGEGSWVYSAYAFLHCVSERAHPARIGRHSGVYQGCFFDLGPEGEVEIGDYAAVVGAVINVNGRLHIGDYALIAHEVTIADSTWAAPGVIQKAADTWIGDNVWIGARATILAGVRIGDGAIVGAGAVVDTDVPDYAIAAGVPARVVGDSRRKARP